jgi:hypothetical protein
MICICRLYYIIMCTALFYSDSPYGITNAPWDTAWDSKKLDKILKQFGATQVSDHCVACIWHNPLHLADFKNTLSLNDYGESCCYYWHKTQHHTPTPVSSYTSSVEQAIIAFKPNRYHCPFNQDKDPRKRHNFQECYAVTKYELDDSGVAINKCQKPPALSRRIAETHCVPGEWVLNVGPGSGGCLLGLLHAGVNVVAIESDFRQFQLLQGTVWKWKQEGTYIAPITNEEEDDAKNDDDNNDNENDDGPGRPSTPASNVSVDKSLHSETTSTNEDENGIQCAGCYYKIPDPDNSVTCSSPSCGEQEFYHAKCTTLLEGVRLCRSCFDSATLSPPNAI